MGIPLGVSPLLAAGISRSSGISQPRGKSLVLCSSEAGGQHFGAVHHALGPLCLLHADSLPGAQFVQLLSLVRAQTSLRFDQAPLFPLPNRTENGIYGSSVEPPSCPEGGQQISRLQLLRAPSSDQQPVSLNPSLLPTRGRQQGPIPAF